MKPAIKDEPSKELEDIIKRPEYDCRPAVMARLIPECTPDSSHSCRYHLIGIYESPVSLIPINQVVVEISQNQVVTIGKWKFQKIYFL
jgi:hypothetical protein